VNPSFRVIGSDLATPIGVLDQPYEAAWFEEGLGVGGGQFKIPHDSPFLQANPTALNRDNVIVVYDADNPAWPGFAFLVRRRLRTRGDVWDPIQVSGPGVLELLRLGLVEYARGVGTGAPSDERPFGWMAVDYDDSGGCWASPAPYSGGQWRRPRFSSKAGQPDGFPDPIAEWIGPEALAPTPQGGQGHTPDDYWYLRHALVGGYSGPARIWISADDAHLTYFNGTEVAEGDDWRRMQQIDIELTGNDVLAIEVYNTKAGPTNNPSEVVYTIGTVGDEGQLDQVLFRSTSGAVFSEARNEVQSIVLDPDTPPFPWGSSYPSTGPEQLQGTWRIVYGSQTSGAIQWDAGASAVKAAIDTLVDGTVTVTGSGTSGSPWSVTFNGGAAAGKTHPLLGVIHTDLRHNHATTRTRRIASGRTAVSSAPGEDAIRVCPFPGSPPGVTIGHILKTLLEEAQDRGFLSGITLGFDAVTDSRGVPWADEIVLVLQVGNDNVLSAGERVREQGADLWMGPDFVFHAAQDRGVDRSASVEIPAEIAYGLEVETEDEEINALLVRTDAGWFRWGSPPGGKRREGFLTLGLQPSTSASTGLASAVLAASSRSRSVVRFFSRSGMGPQPYDGFGPLDRIRVPYIPASSIVGPWSSTVARVDTIAGRVNPLGETEWSYEVEAEDG
jgi:hypothetical protein